MAATITEYAPITAPPRSYYEWLKCFDALSSRTVGADEFSLLMQGECVDADRSIEYLEEQLVRTINAMIQRYIHMFNREIDMYASQGDYDGLYLSFCKLAGKFRHCLFFRSLEFMSTDFREELSRSVESELSAFWQRVIRSLYLQCMEQNDFQMEDQIYMIRRIRLFKP